MKNDENINLAKKILDSNTNILKHELTKSN
jgi:hypothetical protein